MAATFVVEDGTGKSDANAFASVAAVDQYWDNHGAPTTWTGLAQATKEKHIRMATQYLMAVYGERWKGTRLSSTQALDFPRWGIRVRDGWILNADTIPQSLIDATAEAAHRDATETDGLLPDLDAPASVEEEMIKAGPITERIKYADAKPPRPAFTIIENILRELIEDCTLIERG